MSSTAVHTISLILWIIAGLILLLMVFHKPQKDDSNVIYICRKCFESRYANTWLGMRISRRPCQVCHETKTVDRIPLVNNLRPKDRK